MLMELLKIKGSVVADLFGPDGKLKKRFSNHNLIVTAGKNFLATWLAASSQSTKFMTHIAMGSGNGAPAVGDTALGVQLARVAGTITASTNVYQNIGFFDVGVGTGTAAEVGLFSQSVGGTMFSRALIGPFTKGATDTLTITWTLTIS